ncbi:hypothetical protein tinsulaeT_20910 [Thalassotalea insulae]|uniref:Uncharacterized protein n=1 Tax=Thalassotalea insulae TaxID=2056778 RepID=A0ABQ6GVR5_9GAMM|nr:hypothetical protein [Thalassotalea insulae]GLX78751.1 hypothetical protein tinsulaeT_20910 [Thalassotalea insulae]
MNKALYLSAVIGIFSGNVIAENGYSAGHTINKLYIQNDGYVSFGTDKPVTDSCNYFGYQFTFDTTTEAGKSKLSLLLAAKMAEKKVNLWYRASTTPGTDQNNGCTRNTMALVYSVGLD